MQKIKRASEKFDKNITKRGSSAVKLVSNASLVCRMKGGVFVAGVFSVLT